MASCHSLDIHFAADIDFALTIISTRAFRDFEALISPFHCSSFVRYLLFWRSFLLHLAIDAIISHYFSWSAWDTRARHIRLFHFFDGFTPRRFGSTDISQPSSRAASALNVVSNARFTPPRRFISAMLAALIATVPRITAASYLSISRRSTASRHPANW
jgi:hypothetical protein